MCDLRVADMPKRFGPAAGYSRDSTIFIAQVTFSAATNPALAQGVYDVAAIEQVVAKSFFLSSALIIISAARD